MTIPKPQEFDYGMYQESRIVRVETTIENINQTLIRLEKKIDNLENKMDSGFKFMNDRSWTNFYWTIAGFTSVLLVLAHGLHWI